MTRKVETEANSPTPGGAAEDLLPRDTNNNSNSETATDPHINSGSDISNKCDSKNKVSLKYALRPRSQQHRSLKFEEDIDLDVKCTSPTPKRSPRGGKRGGGRRNHKPRHLSRYKRKNANARERGRMAQINTAFEALKGALPSIMSPKRGGSPQSPGGGTTTITKISTLRLAVGYIQALQDILDADERGETLDDANTAYNWLLSSLLQEEEEEEEAQHIEDTNDQNAWALPYFIHQGKRSLPLDVSKFEPSWAYSEIQQHGIGVDPPLKRLKHEPQHTYLDETNKGELTFIYTETNELGLEHITSYPNIADTDTLNLLLDQKTNTIPSYDTIMV